MANSENQRSNLTEGLVTDKYFSLYNNNAFFRQFVDTLVQMLPVWIDGAAIKAEMDEGRIEEMAKMAMMPPAPVQTEFEHIDKPCYVAHPGASHRAWLGQVRSLKEGFDEGRGGA